ncbi:hypothetical protein DFJ63DRAFT_320530 [Scheffersomyces coipomensis]|uniref:uncharacterized protein n=1 Tax=Scheffersomyces coipomensis TaxID=1788519 RepID=UPI00315C5DCF
MTKLDKKNKKVVQPLDLDNCQTLEHLMPVPKSRSSSIISIESEDKSEIKTMLAPPARRDFDDLFSFESFIRDETWDNEFDYYHAHLQYYPPFVLKECRDNLDKIKPTMNKNNKRFKRHLQHHINKHLIKDIEKCCGYKLNLEKAEIIDTPKSVTWKFKDLSDHGFTQEEEDLFDRHWKLELEISCNNENAMVEVDYKSVPLV